MVEKQSCPARARSIISDDDDDDNDDDDDDDDIQWDASDTKRWEKRHSAMRDREEAKRRSVTGKRKMRKRKSLRFSEAGGRAAASKREGKTDKNGVGKEKVSYILYILNYSWRKGYRF